MPPFKKGHSVKTRAKDKRIKRTTKATTASLHARHTSDVSLHWTCKVCPLAFHTRDQLRNHIKQQHPNADSDTDSNHNCNACPLLFDTREQLRQHKKQQHPRADPKSAIERKQKSRAAMTEEQKETHRAKERDRWKENDDKYNANRRKRYDEKNTDIFAEQRDRAAKTFVKYPDHPLFNEKSFNEGIRTDIANIVGKNPEDVENADVWGIQELFEAYG